MVSSPSKIPDTLRSRNIRNSFLNNLPGGRRFYRHLSFAGPFAAELLDLSGYDLVISSDGTFTKGVITDQKATHICYCHSPHRSLWDRYAEYRRSLPIAIRIPFLLSAHYLRRWDYLAAQRPDVLVANSRYVRERIYKFYGRISEVIYPPAGVEEGKVAENHDDYYLSVGRLDEVKRTDIIVKACTELGRRLIVIGEGPEKERLSRMAGPSIEFRSWLPDGQVRELYQRCRACLFAAEEDLGLVPIEAQSYGKPVIALGRGGARETVIDGVGGVHFSEQSLDSLRLAILQFEATEQSFCPTEIRQSVSKFSTERFKRELTDLVARTMAKKEERLRSSECSAYAKRKGT